MGLETLLIALTILSAIGVGWSIGANDAANSLGTAVGARVITMRAAIIQIMVFGLLGALFQGSEVTAKIGKGIVAISELPGNMPSHVALVSTLSAFVWVGLATFFKMPISTSHSVVGAVAGAGLAIHAPIKWTVLSDIFLCWIFTPLGAALCGYVIYRLLRPIFTRFIPSRVSIPLVRILVVVSGWYVAFTWGANDVANAVGVISGAGLMTPFQCLALGGLAIALGIVTWGHRVIETVGSSITNLLPLMAFSAQLASGINVHLYTLAGMPVSTSHSIVGAIFGVGLVQGMRVVNTRILKEIVTCWLATPFVSGLVSYLLLKGLLLWLKLN